MTDHLYTPAGMSGATNSSKLKGKDAAIAELLELAHSEGIDLAWDRGTVWYNESGYGEDDRYRYMVAATFRG